MLGDFFDYPLLLKEIELGRSTSIFSTSLIENCCAISIFVAPPIPCPFTFAIYLCLPIPRYHRRSLFEDYQALYYSLFPESAQWLLNRHRRIRAGSHLPSL